MIIFRGIAISLPQVLILLDVGARFDLLFGFNRTDYGFTTLLFLVVLVPLVALSWFIIETIVSIRLARREKRAMSLLMPGLALLFLIESLVIDILMVLQARM
ncbi:MAG: hypothetical protein ACM34I_00970 [bacterium]